MNLTYSMCCAVIVRNPLWTKTVKHIRECISNAREGGSSIHRGGFEVGVKYCA